MVLEEVLNKLQDFCWITQERDQVSMLEKFCNKYFEINAGHFSKVILADIETSII